MTKVNLHALRNEMMGDLNRYNIYLLREQGSKLGVKSVTTHSKERLVELIIEKKLQNHTSYEIEMIPESNDEFSTADKERLMELHLNPDGEEYEIVSGILELRESIDGFIRVYDYKQSGEDIFVPQGIINEYELRYGDRIVGKAVKMQRYEWRGLISVVSINGQKPSDVGRKNFSKATACCAKNKIDLGKAGDSLLKMIDIFSPVAKGQRNMVFLSSPMNLLKPISGMMKAFAADDVNATVLCLSEKPETIACLKREFGGSVVATDCDTSQKHNERVAQLVLESLKREVENGKDVALIVSNMAALCGSENRLVLEREFSYKTLFGSARQLESGGSLTIVGFSFLFGQLGEQIYETLVPLANSVSALVSEEGVSATCRYDIFESYSDFFDYNDTEKEINNLIKKHIFDSGFDEHEIFEFYDSLKSQKKSR